MVGVAGYMLIEGWPLLDAVYMTVTTISTVGFGELHTLSATGRVFTMVLILMGIGTLGFEAIQFRVAENFPPRAFGKMGLGRGGFPLIGRAGIGGGHRRHRRGPVVVRSGGAACEQRQRERREKARICGACGGL